MTNIPKIKPGFLTGRHPLCLLVFFVSVICISMFSGSPMVLAVSLLFSLATLAKLKGIRGMLRFLRLMLVLAFLTAVINPLFNHRGRTIIARFKNGQPLTLSSFTVLPDDAKLFSDFEQGISGEAVFSLNNSPAKIFYAPVDGTEWTAAVLVRP